MKRFLAIALAGTLALGSMGVTVYGSTFTDINTVPWSGAATFIDQAQTLGLMSGYNENGKRYCKPRNNVTYVETAQMIYSIMKTYSKTDVTSATVTKWTPVMSAYNIPSWAYSAVAYCLENSILTTTDLSKLKDGTGYATREDVGVIFGKALSSIYTVNNSATLTYADSKSVSSSAVPYLALLKSQSLMVGDTDNKFNPASKINRAEMAVLSVKTYNKLNGGSSTTTTTAASGTVSGTIVNSMVLTNGDLFISVSTTGGAGLNLFGEKGKVAVEYDSQEVTPSDIGEGDSVTVTYKDDAVSKVVITKSKAGISSLTNYTLTKLTSSKITVKGTSDSKTYNLAEDVTVTISGSKSSISKLQDAMEDDDYKVALTLDKAGDVTKIAAVLSSNNPLTGDISYLSDSKISITVGAKDYSYPLYDGDISVKYDGKTVLFSTLEDNYKSSTYTVTLKLNSRGEVTDITVSYMEDETHGTIEFLNSRRIELKSGKKTYDYDLNDDVTVKIDNKKADIDDLVDTYKDKAYNISLTIDRYNGVSEILATTKNSGSSDGTLKELTSSSIKIKSGSKTYEYDLDDPTIKIDGSKVTLSELRKVYEDFTYEVELEFNSKGEVTTITGKNKTATKGVLKNIEPSKDEITITCGSVDYDYDMTSSVTITIDGSSATAKELDNAFEDKAKSEDIDITLTLNNSDKVTKVVATTNDSSSDTIKGTLRSLDEWQISIKKSSSSKTYDFASGNITLTLDGKSISFTRLNDALDDLDNDQYIEVTLYVNSKDQVTRVKATTETEDDDDDKPTEGTLTKVSSDSIKIKKSSKSYTWTLDEDCTFRFNINSRDYDEDDYKDSYKGLQNFLNDCDDNGDDVYVTLKTSGSKVTRVTAEDD